MPKKAINLSPTFRYVGSRSQLPTLHLAYYLGTYLQSTLGISLYLYSVALNMNKMGMHEVRTTIQVIKMRMQALHTVRHEMLRTG